MYPFHVRRQIKLGAANRDLEQGGGGGGGSGMVEMAGELSVDDALDRVKSRSLKELAIAEARDNELEQRRRHGLNVSSGGAATLALSDATVTTLPITQHAALIDTPHTPHPTPHTPHTTHHTPHTTHHTP